MTWNLFLLVVAVVLFIILGLVGAGWLVTVKDDKALWGLLGFGLAAFAAAHIDYPHRP